MNQGITRVQSLRVLYRLLHHQSDAHASTLVILDISESVGNCSLCLCPADGTFQIQNNHVVFALFISRIQL